MPKRRNMHSFVGETSFKRLTWKTKNMGCDLQKKTGEVACEDEDA
jgi:hypothetical protein